MGSTLLINGQPLMGTTGTISLYVVFSYNSSVPVNIVSLPIITPLMDINYSNGINVYPESQTSLLLTNVVGTITITLNNNSGSNWVYLTYYYVNPSTIYTVNSYFSSSSQYLGFLGSNGSLTATISISNLVSFYAWVQTSATIGTIQLRGSIVYTVVNTL
jgi:hypothetical protein